jgi:hypothetical protein
VPVKFKTALRTTAAIVVGMLIAALIVQNIKLTNSMAGAVVIDDPDPRKQLPLPDAEITGEVGGETAQTRSDVSGFFRLTWPRRFWKGRSVTIHVKRLDYQPLERVEPMAKELCVLHMVPVATAQNQRSSEISLTNVRVRYSIRSNNTFDVGSKAETFSVVNEANVPCEGRRPCSPDGTWKAALGSFSLDAGEGQTFQNARVSCIAGPCPFTRVEVDGFTHGGRKISGTVRAWSETTTFLVEAEILHTAVSDMVRWAYPSIYGRTMTFTLPPGGQGPAVQADINGTQVVFPLGPALVLSWATCNMQEKSGIRVYSCVLNPGYKF